MVSYRYLFSYKIWKIIENKSFQVDEILDIIKTEKIKLKKIKNTEQILEKLLEEIKEYENVKDLSNKIHEILLLLNDVQVSELNFKRKTNVLKKYEIKGTDSRIKKFLKKYDEIVNYPWTNKRLYLSEFEKILNITEEGMSDGERVRVNIFSTIHRFLEENGELKNKKYVTLLFDEVEKAHPDIFNVLLQVLDDGVLTDSKGRKVDFSNTIIIMTSNLGATSLRDDKTVGFGARDVRFDHENMEKRMMEELKKAYRPEFINRIDEKVVFHSLTSEDMQEVVKIMVQPLISSLAEKGIKLKFQPSALKLLAQEGYDPEMGARPLRRILQTRVEDHLSELLLSGELKMGQSLKVGVKAGKLKFEVL